MSKFQEYMPYPFLWYAIVNNIFIVFHDKKRRINYYRVKRILLAKEGNLGPMEITPD